MREKVAMSPNPDWPGLEKNRVRPDGRPAMYQTWSDLLFLHSRVSASVIQEMLPEGLTVETFDGDAWLGFVPFRMSNIRPRSLPAVPWLSAFCETNIRTYVTHPEFGPGVWFFSLDASRYLGCLIARMWFSLPYFQATMALASKDNMRVYMGRRSAMQLLPSIPAKTPWLERYKIVAARAEDWRAADPESFEFWLVERYRLYTLLKNGDLATAQVHHSPYEIAKAEVKLLEIEGLNDSFGDLEYTSALMARPVNVECFSPVRISPELRPS